MYCMMKRDMNILLTLKAVFTFLLNPNILLLIWVIMRMYKIKEKKFLCKCSSCWCSYFLCLYRIEKAILLHNGALQLV